MFSVNMKGNWKYAIITLILCVLACGQSFAQLNRPYLCDFGIQGGVGYYVGDAQQYVFMHPRYEAGLFFRYKFDQRWSLKVKGEYQTFAIAEHDGHPHYAPTVSRLPEASLPMQQMVNVDVVAEFNFLRFGYNSYNPRVKPYTPYVFLGVGFGLYDGQRILSVASAYIPVGVGFKWKFAERWGLQAAWQHNLYFKDNLEGVMPECGYDNPGEMNGRNPFNNDRAGNFTIGIVFEFAQQKPVCRHCEHRKYNRSTSEDF